MSGKKEETNPPKDTPKTPEPKEEPKPASDKKKPWKLAPRTGQRHANPFPRK